MPLHSMLEIPKMAADSLADSLLPASLLRTQFMESELYPSKKDDPSTIVSNRLRSNQRISAIENEGGGEPVWCSG